MKFAILLISALALAQAPPLTKAEQFQEAARKGDAAAVKKLLDEGVDVNTKFRYNATALFYASDHAHVEVVKVLLERGADLNVKDSYYGFTPLMLAVSPAQKKRPEHTEVAKLLIAKGAPGQEMALSGAIQANDAGLVGFILEKGKVAPTSLSDALEAARAQNKTEMAALLEKAGAKPHEDFKIDPAQLARYAGTYRTATGNEIVITVANTRLSGKPATGQPALLSPSDEKTFRLIGQAGTTVTFTVEGDKVTAFTLAGPGRPNVVYTRVEGK